MNTTAFDLLSYRQKIIKFKKLVEKAIQLNYKKIQIKRTKFIHYGENATFKVTDQSNESYLVRVCREDYHSSQALNEELSWLSRLSSSTALQVPVPVVNNKKKLFSQVALLPYFKPTNIVIFKWAEGRFIEKKFLLSHARQLGELMARLHLNTKNYNVKHRRYWDADGLLSSKAKLGDLNSLELTKSQRKIIFSLQASVYKKLKKYQQKFPDKMGLIHADMHTGNFFFNKKGIVTIDFDDCGFGFYAYDLAIPIMVLNRIKSLSSLERKSLKQALLSEYRKHCNFSAEDEKMIEVCIYARNLTLLTWLNNRSSIPRLKKYYKIHLTKVLRLKSLR